VAVSLAQLRDLTLWLEHYSATVRTAEVATMAAILAAYEGVDDWENPTLTLAAAGTAMSVALNSQRIHAGLGAEFTDFVLQVVLGHRPSGKPTVALATPSTPVIGGTLYVRNAAPFDVYSRPVFAARKSLLVDFDHEVATMIAQHQAEMLVQTDMLMARRNASQIEMLREPEVTHYRRVIHPELSETGVCGLCIAASTRIYKVADLMPIHTRCRCEPMPIVGGMDPDGFNQVDIERLYAETPGTKRQDLSKTRWTVEDIAELGPVLAPAA
jgi:hypothetical protein